MRSAGRKTNLGFKYERKRIKKDTKDSEREDRKIKFKMLSPARA